MKQVDISDLLPNPSPIQTASPTGGPIQNGNSLLIISVFSVALVVSIAGLLFCLRIRGKRGALAKFNN